MEYKILFLITLLYFPNFIELKRIAGGDEASRGSFPWHAMLKSSSGTLSRLCGGALIKHNWILTAGQCIADVRDSIVRLGIVDRLEVENAVSFRITNRSHLIVHENYYGDVENSIYKNDIGLIFLQSATEEILNTYVKTVALPKDSNIDLVGTMGYATGFGFYDDYENPLQSSKLYSVAMPIIDFEICRQAHGSSVITNEHICTKTTNGLSTCIGDEGAPLINMKEEPTIVGIGSTALQICTQEYPAIFTSVLPYLDWIRGYIDS